ncbi:ribosomal protein L50, mitochondria [Purpureocillium lilacinum]|uniref:Large ribosomal subunit protein mL50 n=1 Tax=Purpureocillium lilacinum TaxID=33203 RepID=A0A179GNF7_PURLI|nr:ribosomal protein L50, mitochondria [Purpureocillium lilacinum]
MPRIPRVSGLKALPLNLAPSSASPARPSFAAARAISTTCVARGKNTEWVRGKLWKGEAPGPEDPYTQRPEPEESSNLPEEALEYQPHPDRTPAQILASRLTLPPKRTEATPESQLKSSDPTYVPATDAEGLEEISTITTWWDQPGHWGAESEFDAFGSVAKVADKEIVEVYLRRAVVELLALQESGVFADWATKKWNEGDRSALDSTLAVEIQVQDGKASLNGDASSLSQGLTAELEEVDTPERVTLDEAKELVKAWDPAWKSIALDEQAKFAVRKRLYQLTGNLVPDAKLAAATTVKHILTLAAKEPKPQKLTQLLSRRDDLQRLSNVKVHSHKIRAIEKETVVGRWKVIEEELKKRGLPVTGTAGLSKNKERDWITGKA